MTDEQRMESAEAVYRGVVTGVRIPAWEAETAVRADAHTRKNHRSGRTNYEYRVVVDETLKGAAEELLIFNVSWCYGGRADLKEEVIVYRSAGPMWHIKGRAPDRK